MIIVSCSYQYQLLNIASVCFSLYYSPDLQVETLCLELCCLLFVCVIWPSQLSCLGSLVGRASAECCGFESRLRQLMKMTVLGELHCIVPWVLWFIYKDAGPAVRHTGPTLWLQQFVAMFLKRFYNSLRFYIAVITQLVLPLIFILLALILIKIPNPNLGDQPPRSLTLKNSALSRNVTTFWAQFGDTPAHFNFAVWNYKDN